MQLSPQEKLLIVKIWLCLFKTLEGNGFASQFFLFVNYLHFFDIQFWQEVTSEPQKNRKKAFLLDGPYNERFF